MIITKDNIDEALEDIYKDPLKGFDTETYGVRFQDRLFSLIVATEKGEYYFNFNADPDHLGNRAPIVLGRDEVLGRLRPLFDRGVWSAHNAPFDLQKLRLEIPGFFPKKIHCTLSTERVLRNDFLSYSLEEVAKRYGLEKDASVDEYIKKHGLSTKVRIPGKKRVDEVPRFDLVPFEIMVKYGCKDAKLSRQIAAVQRFALGLSERDEADPNNSEHVRDGNTVRPRFCAEGLAT